MSLHKTVRYKHSSPLLKKGLPARRAQLVLGLSLIGFVVLAGRAVYLQGMNHEFLQAQGEARHVREVAITATRGQITDRNGDLLATSVPVKSIWAEPEKAQKLSPAEQRQLAALLDIPTAEFIARLRNAKGRFTYLKRQVEPAIAASVAQMKLSGIHQLPEYQRFYPSGAMMAHVVGFTNVEDRGQEGVELAFEKHLSGHPGQRRVLRDRRGRIIEDLNDVRPPQNGSDLKLAMDSKLQHLTHTALQQAIRSNRAKAGAIVVLDVKTGEILALANAPTFNPNNRQKLSGAQLRNRVLTDTYEPGSTIKPFIIASALDRGLVRPHTVIPVDYGYHTVAGRRISDISHKYETLTVSEVVQKSSNVGAVKIAMRFQPQEMWQLFNNLGFGRALDLGFPGEAKGKLRAAQSWKPIEQATMSFGYGLSASLMQMAHAYTVFGNDGKLVPLSLLRTEGQKPLGKQVFSARTAHEVLAMMEAATDEDASLFRARVPGYRVAGKSGTAHKVEGRRYAARKYISSFIGLAPVSDPRIVIAIMIDEPNAGAHYGGAVAAPVFSQLAQGVLHTLGITPDMPLPALQVAAQTLQPGQKTPAPTPQQLLAGVMPTANNGERL